MYSTPTRFEIGRLDFKIIKSMIERTDGGNVKIPIFFNDAY